MCSYVTVPGRLPGGVDGGGYLVTAFLPAPLENNA